MSEIDIKSSQLKSKNFSTFKLNSNLFLRLAFILILIDLFLTSNIFLPEIRIQDLAIVITVIFSKPLFKMIFNDKYLKRICLFALLYFFYLILTNLIYIPLNGLWYRFILYVLKEIEFFIIFILTIYNLRGIRNNKIIKLIKIFIIINIIYGFYQVVTGSIAHYGIGTLVSPAPSVSGNVYFLSFVIFLYFYYIERKKYLLILSALLYILILCTVSRTYIIISTLFMILIIIIPFIRKYLNINLDRINLRKIIIFIFSIIIVLIALLITINLNDKPDVSNTIFVKKIVHRMTNFENSADYRAYKSQIYYNTFVNDDLRIILFGSGKGITEQVNNTYTLGVDNQYIRSLIEMGFLGIIFWTNMIIGIFFNIKSNDKKIEKNFFISFLSCYLLAGVGTELFQTIHPGTSFWFFSAILCSNINSKGKNLEIIRANNSKVF